MSATPHSASQLLTEIEISEDDAKRRELLRQACRLFEVTSASLDDHETELFDEILDMMIKKVDTTLRVEISERMATTGEKLSRTVSGLAFDEEISVARPVLETSEGLSDDVLVKVAEQRGQAHMAAIAQRPTLNPTVTDTLVELGDNKVLKSVAVNKGAQFSSPGMSRLADRSEGDSALQSAIAERDDLTPAVVQTLLNSASDEIRQSLMDRSEQTAIVLEKARAEMERRLGVDRVDLVAADRKLRRHLGQDPMTEERLADIAKGKDFAQVTAAIGILFDTSLDSAKQMMIDRNVLLITARAHDLSPATLRAVLRVGPVYRDLTGKEREDALLDYNQMQTETARRVLRFQQTRSKLAASG